MAIYKGTEVKFDIELTAPGFNMDEDDFDIKIVSPKGSITGHKGDTDPGDVIIFREPALSDSSSSDSSSSDSSSSDSSSSDSSSSEENPGLWHVIANTENLSTGDLRVIATAYVRDGHAKDGVRTEIAVCPLDKLINP